MPNSWNELLSLAASGDDARLVGGVRERLAELVALGPRPEPGEPYGRRVLHQAGRGEVLLAGWPRGGRSAPHDHGDAAAFVLVLGGFFVETHYGLDGLALSAEKKRGFSAFDILRAAPGVVHDMHALEAGLTLHFYLPAIRVMRVYDTARHASFVVDGDAGAWLPARAD
jgi:hypothetical protein